VAGTDTIKKDDCYKICDTSKKLASNNIADCDNIDQNSNNFVTKDICIQDKAIKNKNPEFCKSISGTMMRDTCYMGLAQQMKQKNLCNNISNDAIKAGCLQQNTAK